MGICIGAAFVWYLYRIALAQHWYGIGTAWASVCCWVGAFAKHWYWRCVGGVLVGYSYCIGWYGIGMVLVRRWYGIGMVLVWYWYGIGMALVLARVLVW